MSKIESKSLAELEADLFLAERSFKRVPSDGNKEGLAKIKKAYEAVLNVKETINPPLPTTPKVPGEPKAPKVQTTPKATGKVPAATKASKPESKEPAPNTDDSKKN